MAPAVVLSLNKLYMTKGTKHVDSDSFEKVNFFFVVVFVYLKKKKKKNERLRKIIHDDSCVSR